MQFHGTTYPDVKLPCNRENMTKLVEALESGTYEQGHNYLLTEDMGRRKYCCLGVACEISGLGQWRNYGGKCSYSAGNDYSQMHLVQPVKDWLGVDNRSIALSGHAGHPFGVCTAADLNDSFEDNEIYDFRAIAARIREVYLTD
jgi:hypothetical protein